MHIFRECEHNQISGKFYTVHLNILFFSIFISKENNRQNYKKTSYIVKLAKAEENKFQKKLQTIFI